MFSGRQYFTLYDGRTGKFSVAFRDPNDASSKMYMDLDFPPFDSEDPVDRIVHRLNQLSQIN